MRHVRPLVLLLFLVSISACASVPREVVDLSQALATDLTEVQRSHEALIRLHFADLRQRTDDFLTHQWQPAYLRHFIEEGGLVELAKDPDPTEVLTGVQDWAEVAVEEIEAKRRELLAPLDAQESELLEATGAAFTRMRTANATITAHLGSIRQVEAARDSELQRLGLGDLRKQLDEGLAKAAATVEEGIRRTKEAEGLVDEAGEAIDTIRRRP